MLSEKILSETGRPGVRIFGNDALKLTLPLLEKILEYVNEERYGLPIAITTDQIKYGNVFRSTYEDCLVLSNTEHGADYFKFAVTLRKQGKAATISTQAFGYSKQGAKMETSAEFDKNPGLGNRIIGSLFRGNRQEFEHEQEYYEMLFHLIDDMYDQAGPVIAELEKGNR